MYVPKRNIVRIFSAQNISVSTIYQTIKECENGIPYLNLPKSGRPRVLTPAREQRLIQSMENQLGKSLRNVGRRYNVSRMTVSRTISRNNLKRYKRKKAPKYIPTQLEKIPRCCRALRRIHFPGKILIMDDEKYFTLSNSEMKGNDGFYTRNVQDAPDEVRFKGKVKFADKILVWCAISEAGVSQPFVGRVRGEALNADIYIDRCLTKLVQFINTHHSNDEIIFWPDLASCHYARRTTDWLTAQNINFVPKRDNPPNVPQARPIEEFWAVLSRMVYNNGWEAQNKD
ncbi:uncharacterized protein LOC126880924 [Diabrotica virgifera virgifera]|uniref:Uncharacterized protein n=1 Tax=Diabrotica virgifera virgifera TaxID=50390 RepID=A0ABM5JSN8_DIAVI|nr:uncharacterized protein LOC126880924 [Diabrotica virgifera virgifera]